MFQNTSLTDVVTHAGLLVTYLEKSGRVPNDLGVRRGYSCAIHISIYINLRIRIHTHVKVCFNIVACVINIHLKYIHVFTAVHTFQLLTALLS